MKNFLRLIVIAVLMTSLISCSVLDTRAKRGAVIGGIAGIAAGAALGQAIGAVTAATLWGAGIGLVVGGVAGHEIGYYMDKQEKKLQEISRKSRRKNVSVDRSQDVLIATIKNFAYDSRKLSPGIDSEMDEVSEVLNRFSKTVILVEGHTDASGDASYNQRLSEERANSIRNALLERHVNPERVVTMGYGETRPLSTAAEKNRRVNIVIIPVKL
ncbi:MAG: OmpA family protein [Thermodesulfobacteriota bacterium]